MAQIDAHSFATYITQHITDAGWNSSDTLTLPHLIKFTEFFAYIIHLTCRNAALSLTLKKIIIDELHDFTFKIRDKLVQDKRTGQFTTAITAFITPKGAVEPSSNSLSTSAKGAKSKVCASCKCSWYKTNSSFQHKAELRKAAKTSFPFSYKDIALKPKSTPSDSAPTKETPPHQKKKEQSC